MPERIPQRLRHLVDNLVHSQRYCHFKKLEQLKAGDYCIFGTAGATPSFALFGDSHADALRPALEKAALETGLSGIQLTTSGCPPLAGAYSPRRVRCRKFTDVAIDIINKSTTIDKVFLAGYWRVAYTGESYRYKNFVLIDHESRDWDLKNNSQVFLRGLQRTINGLPGRQLYFVGDVPDIGINIRKEHLRSLLLNRTGISRHISAPDPLNQELQQLLAAHFKDQITFLDLQKKLCPAGLCSLLIDDQLVFRDGDHLSLFGAEQVSGIFADILKETNLAAVDPSNSVK